MAKTALDQVKGIPLAPEGMNDNIPLQVGPEFYQTRGVHSLSERCLQRMTGKSLSRKFTSPVLNIHGDIKDRIFVETVDTLYLFTDRIDAGGDVDIMEDYILIRDEKPVGTEGGSAIGGFNFDQRDLTAEVIDTGNFASLAANIITLAAGTYRFKITAPAHKVGLHKALLHNITDGLWYAGSSELSAGTNPSTTNSIIVGGFTISAPKTFEILHNVLLTVATIGYGKATSSAFAGTGSDTEIYTIAEFWRTP